MIVGSPEWFHDKSLSMENVSFKNKIEKNRKDFLMRFAPEKIAEMSGEELLSAVFGDGDTMRQELDFDERYTQFGSTGGYKYLGVVYQEAGEIWKYKEGIHANFISYGEAIKRAVEVRDGLLDCISIISEMKPNDISGYEELDNALSKYFFYTYPWVMKYFQMVYPYYFPGMYADNTLKRALDIIGLSNHGNRRIVNAGEVALFIRKCDVNNIAFNKIYSGEWGWEGKPKPCENAKNNFKNRENTSDPINLDYYELLQDEAVDDDLIRLAKTIEEDIDLLDIDGIEKQSLVNIRVNQGVFRERLINRYGKCCLCGVSEKRLLVASHIKPWVSCKPKEKLDINNGFLMCPNHDKLFDQGWISFDNDGNIIISDELNDIDKVFINVNEDMFIDLTEGNKNYLKYHRNNIFITGVCE